MLSAVTWGVWHLLIVNPNHRGSPCCWRSLDLVCWPLLCDNPLHQVFDLGPTGADPARKVAELTDFLGEVARLPSGRNVFTLGEDKRGTAIKYLAVIREQVLAAALC